MKNIEKKEITDKAASKALINSFITYGIIFIFIIFMVRAFFSWATQNISATKTINFTIISSILSGFILYFLFLLLCKISSVDVFKKCKINKDKITNVTDRLTTFFIICAIISVISCFVSVFAKHEIINKDIDKIAYDNYNSFKSSNIAMADKITEERTAEIYDNWNKYLIKLSILESSIILSLFYLIKYQKKMILKYNE